MNALDKIHTEHKQRIAFVYARQSSPRQVLNNRSSTERQLDLTHVAGRLGWSTTQVQLVADDLGRSGKLSENRDGFQRMVAEVSLGRVGAVFCMNASRLARSSADWHRLLEIAALTRTLIVDEHTVYDPRDANDRLLLGMQGTMAEFELVWLRQRMEEGKWYLARKGKLRLSRPPTGYVYDEDARLVMDPDEQVRVTVGLLFERFRMGGSCGDVIRYFQKHELRFPARDGTRVCWRRLTLGRVRQVLHNPLYAGAYVFGRSRWETTLEQGQRRRRLRTIPMNQWPVVKQDAHTGYISWEEYVANQKRLADNQTGAGKRGAARRGVALLQGMLLCGRCGTRFRVQYRGHNGRYPVYICDHLRRNCVGELCLDAPVRNIDKPVTELVLTMLSSHQLQIATKVVELLEQEDAALHKQWELTLERARYEAKRAERQYDACDPDNRVVARTLETRWNEKLVQLEQLEREYEQVQRSNRIEITDADRQRIIALAEDIPKLWHAKSTTDRDRKLLLRLLIQDVSVKTIDLPLRALQIRVLWHTQVVSEIEADRPGKGKACDSNINWRVVSTTVPDSSPGGAL